MTDQGEILVAGVGCSEFGVRPECTFGDLLCEAVFEALWDAGIEPNGVDAAWLTTSALGERRRAPGELGEAVGLSEIPMTLIAGGPTGGGAAFRSGVLALASGFHDVVLVAGAEKQAQRTTVENLRVLPVRSSDPVFARGISPAGVAGLFARRHLESSRITRAHLDAILVKNRIQGENNPKAAFTRRLSTEEIEGAPMLADPLTVLDIALPVDGAAAVVLARPTAAGRARSRPAMVKGTGYSVVGGSVLPFFDANVDFLTRRAPRSACFQAYAQAGVINAWSQLSVAEVDDAATIYELISYEDLSLCADGEAGGALEQGFTAMGGRLPVNPSGGTLACGSAPAADVLRRIYEVVRQLQGRAGGHQVSGAKLGIVHGATWTGSEGFVAVLEQAPPRTRQE